MSAAAAGGAELEAEHQALLEFLYLCPVGLLQVDGTGAVALANPLAAQILMPIARSPVIVNLFDLLEPIAPDVRNMVDAFEAPRGKVVENRRVHVGDVRAGRGPRRADPLVLSLTLIKVEADRFMAVIADVSAQAAQERRLRETETWFAALLTGVNDFALFSLDAQGRIDSWNQSGERLTGFCAEEAIGRRLDLFLPPGEDPRRASEQPEFARRDGWHLEEGWRERKDGARIWCQCLVSALDEEGGAVTGFSVVLRDVSERKASGDDLRRLLTTDHLTGAVNRARFFELAQAEVVRFRRVGRPLSALMIDADYFKAINDAHGHAGGDAVLKALAAACRGALREVDTLARLGGEEFAVLLPSTDLAGAHALAERLRLGVERLRIDVGGGHAVSLTVSIGCAEMTETTDGIDALLREADAALYEAKQGGRNRVAIRPAALAAE